MAKDISKALKEVEINLEEGDIVVLYTDGITEAKNASASDGILFGIDRLMETVEKADEKTASGIFNAITVTLSRFMGYNHTQFDDITLLVIHYHGKNVVEDSPKPIPDTILTEWKWDMKEEK